MCTFVGILVYTSTILHIHIPYLDNSHDYEDIMDVALNFGCFASTNGAGKRSAKINKLSYMFVIHG